MGGGDDSHQLGSDQAFLLSSPFSVSTEYYPPICDYRHNLVWAIHYGRAGCFQRLQY